MSKQRLDYIDGLRGVAILGVVLVHCTDKVKDLPSQIMALAEFGANGVQLFFILSALTLLTIYAKSQFSYSEFLVRRFFRIAPAFYAATLFYAFAPYLDAPHPDVSPLLLNVTTLLFLHNWLPQTVTSVVPGGWSVGVEAMFYLCFPLMLRHINSLARALVACIIAALLGIFYAAVVHRFAPGAPAIENYIYFGLVWNILPFTFGALLFTRLDQSAKQLMKSWRGGVALGLCALLLALAAAGVAPLARHIIVAPLLATLVFLARETASPLFTNAPIRLLGKISFSLYLIHFALLDLLQSLAPPGFAALDPLLRYGVFVLAVLTLGGLLAYLSWRCIEEPGIALGRRLADALRRRRAALRLPAGPRVQARLKGALTRRRESRSPGGRASG